MPQLASAKIKCQLCDICEEKKANKFVAHTACVSRVDRTARQKLELWIFLLISWCQQLTSSSCDVRVHFRVARQCYFKCKANAVGHYHILIIIKCVLLRLFTVKTLLFLKICTLEFMLHWGKPTMKWFFPCRSMRPIGRIKSWFQLHTSIHRWTREWIKTEIMQNGFEIMPLS